MPEPTPIDVYAVARLWAEQHGHQTPDDRLIDLAYTAGRVDAARDIRVTKRRLFARIIAAAGLLDQPFSDQPELSVWELLKRDMTALNNTLAAIAKERTR